jgi:uncharacterized membrane protein/protein-disulfide isomerase
MGRNTANPLLAWPLATLSLVACGLSAYLWYASASAGGVAGCDWGAFDCDAALGSSWAKVLGVPVAAFGLACYLMAAIGAVLVAVSSSRIGWRLLELATPAAVGGAIWFTALQAFSLETFCLYCVLTHACGLGVAALAIALRVTAPRRSAPALVGITPGMMLPATAGAVSVGPPSLGVPTVASLLGVLGLVLAQLTTPAPGPRVVEADALPADLQVEFAPAPAETAAALGTEPVGPSDPAAQDAGSEPAMTPPSASETAAAKLRAEDAVLSPRRRPTGSREVSFLGGRLKVDLYDHPLLGSPDAPNVVLEFMDYACPHCREFHEKVAEAMLRYPGEVAIVVMPVPSEILCNPYVPKARKQSRGACRIAKLSVATADAAPSSFGKLHRWLLEGDNLPEYGLALSQAHKLVDAGKLSQSLSSDATAARIQQYVKLFASMRSAGVTGLPTQVLKDRAVSGPAKSVEALCDLWVETFNLGPAKVELPF